MSQYGDRTEAPTPQRLKKAREEGRVAVSREFPFALSWLAFTFLCANAGGDWYAELGRACQATWRSAVFAEGNLQQPLTLLAPWWGIAGSMAAAAGVIWIAGFAGHLAVTGLVLTPAKLKFDLNRLNPASRLAELPKQNLGSAGKALLLLPLLAFLIYLVIEENAALLLESARMPVRAAAARVGTVVLEVLQRAAILFLLLGLWDFFRQRRKWMDGLRMTKQEIRDEWKEQEGSPEIKGRIRRMRRDLLRRRMMSAVPTATAVVVNPTHFAVALRYEAGAMGAPKVVAKGRNYLAQRIRETAMRHQIPIIENPPLARALYKTVEVGQEIPVHLYRAVAEILAYLHRLMNGRMPNPPA